jgi:putative hemolysin
MNCLYKYINNLFLIVIILICVYAIIPRAVAMSDPSAVYCTALGYTYGINKTPQGDHGYCILPDNKTADAWQFLQGEVSPEYSGCAKKGYSQKIVYNKKICSEFMTESCAVCVLDNTTETEVTKFMNLSFDTTRCGDNHCSFGENYKTCPGDCPSGGRDEYCDRVKDGICDRDCTRGEDPDCPLPILKSTETGTSVPTTPLPQRSPTPTATPGFAIATGIIGLAAGISLLTKRAKR